MYVYNIQFILTVFVCTIITEGWYASDIDWAMPYEWLIDWFKFHQLDMSSQLNCRIVDLTGHDSSIRMCSAWVDLSEFELCEGPHQRNGEIWVHDSTQSPSEIVTSIELYLSKLNSEFPIFIYSTISEWHIKMKNTDSLSLVLISCVRLAIRNMQGQWCWTNSSNGYASNGVASISKRAENQIHLHRRYINKE